MKSTIRILLLTAMTLVLSAPASNGGSLSLHVGHGNFGIAVSSSDWGVYRDTWYDSNWSPRFTATLDGYGEWVWVSGLGRVWRPWVAVDWRPYTHGQWVHSSLGWTWVSYEPWGYVPHHYGEWALTTYGWAWVPGYEYHPARVTWVQHGSWLGWYPRAPRGWSHAHHAYKHGYDRGYDNGYWDGWSDARHATWVPWKHLGTENLARHSVSALDVRRQGRNAPTTLNAGPSSHDIRRHGGRVKEVEMEHRQATIDGRSLAMARPRGMSEVVERHAAPTVDRALSSEARQRMPSSTRSAPGERSVRPATEPSKVNRGATARDDRAKSVPTVTRRETTGRDSLSRAPSQRVDVQRQRPGAVEGTRAQRSGAASPTTRPTGAQHTLRRDAVSRPLSAQRGAATRPSPSPVTAQAPKAIPSARQGGAAASREGSRQLKRQGSQQIRPETRSRGREAARKQSATTRPAGSTRAQETPTRRRR